jgi:DNA invertase Pin-like site-specific DNA recombinase
MNERKDRRRRVDGYVRVSDVHGRDELRAPEMQQAKIEGWAKMHDHEIIAWEEELDVSGGKLRRPGLDRIMRRIRSGETDGIAVAHLDRLSRAGVGDALELIDEIVEKHGAIFGCVAPQIDTSDEVFGRFALTIFLAMAAMERARIRQNWLDAEANAQKRGVYKSRPPFGYRKRKDGREELDPVQGAIVKELFNKAAAGEGLMPLTSWLNDSGVGPPDGGVWARNTVRYMLRNRAYLGERIFRGRSIRDAAPPLIDPVTFQAASRRRPRQSSGKGDPRSGGRLLVGFVYCGGCRYSTNVVEKRERYKPRYVCSHSKLCPAPASMVAESHSWKAGRHTPEGTYDKIREYAAAHPNDTRASIARVFHVDQGVARKAVIDRIQGPVKVSIKGLEEYVVDEMFDALRGRYEIGLDAYDQSGIDEAQQRLRDAEANRDAFAKDIAAMNTMGRDAWLVASEAHRNEVEDAKRQLDTKLRETPRLDQSVRELEDDFRNHMTLDEKRSRLQDVIQAVFIGQPPNGKGGSTGPSRSRVDIVYVWEPEVDIPRPGRRGWRPIPWEFSNAEHPDDIGPASPSPAQI